VGPPGREGSRRAARAGNRPTRTPTGRETVATALSRDVMWVGGGWARISVFMGAGGRPPLPADRLVGLNSDVMLGWWAGTQWREEQERRRPIQLPGLGLLCFSGAPHGKNIGSWPVL
jgi:hypothetical protein